MLIMIRKNWKKAAELLLADYDKLKNSAGYQYDLANVLEQVLSNTAQEYQKKMAAAFRSGDAEEFSTLSDKFLSIIDMVEKVTGTQKEFLVGTWINGAKKLAENSDDFYKRTLRTECPQSDHHMGKLRPGNQRWTDRLFQPSVGRSDQRLL